MKPTQKVVIEQLRNNEKYLVKKLVNRTEPKIGSSLTEKQVQDLIDLNCASRKITVEIVSPN